MEEKSYLCGLNMKKYAREREKDPMRNMKIRVQTIRMRTIRVRTMLLMALAMMLVMPLQAQYRSRRVGYSSGGDNYHFGYSKVLFS